MVCKAVTLRTGSMQICGGGSRERRYGAALEPLAQRSDALGGAHPTLARNKFRTNLVAGETASGERSVHRGLTLVVCRAVTLRVGSVQTYGAAHVSDVTALPLSPSHSAVMPSAV